MASANRRLQSRAATLLEVGPVFGAAVGLLVVTHHNMTHKARVVHCSPRAAASCIGQVTSHTVQGYVVAAGLGAAAGLAFVTMLLMLWRFVLAPAAPGRQ